MDLKPTYINVPVDYMEEAKTNRFRSQLLSFWLCIKFMNGDSVYKPTVSGIMRDFGCGHTLASKLYEYVTTNTSNKLFRYNSYTGKVVATTWKLGPQSKYFKLAPNQTSLMKYCVKTYRPSRLTIRTVFKAIQAAHVKVPMSEMQRLDNFLKEEKFSNCLDRAKALNQTKLGRIVGCHRSTISRLIKQMESSGDISVKRSKLVKVRDNKHEIWLIPVADVMLHSLDKRKLIRIGKDGYVRDAYEYRLSVFDKERDVRNVIINHASRIGRDLRNTTKKVNQVLSKSKVDDFYDKFDIIFG